MSETSEIDTPAVDANLACCGCGYLLRGLKPDGQCPECGQSIALSVGGGHLAIADPLWIMRLYLGANFCLIAIIGTIAISAIILSGFISVGIPRTIWDFIDFSSIYFSKWAIYFVGVWLLASQPRSESRPGPVILKGAAIIDALLKVILLTQYIGYDAYLFATTVVATAFQILVLLQLRRLARLASDPFVAQHTIILIWFSAAIFVLESAIRFTERLNVGGNALIVELLGIGLIVYYAIVINRFRLTLKRALSINPRLRASHASGATPQI